MIENQEKTKKSPKLLETNDSIDKDVFIDDALDTYKQNNIQSINKELNYCQFMKGDKINQTFEIDSIISEGGMELIVFTDGSRINKKLENKYFVFTSYPEGEWIFTEKVIDDMVTAKGKDGKEYKIPGPDHGRVVYNKKRKDNITITKPKSSNKQTSKQKNIDPKEPTELKQNDKQSDLNPIKLLLENAKKEKRKYLININIDTISPELYSIVCSNFENGKEKTLDYIISLIDMDILKEQLKDKLNEAYVEVKAEGKNES